MTNDYQNASDCLHVHHAERSLSAGSHTTCQLLLASLTSPRTHNTISLSKATLHTLLTISINSKLRLGSALHGTIRTSKSFVETDSCNSAILVTSRASESETSKVRALQNGFVSCSVFAVTIVNREDELIEKETESPAAAAGLDH